MNEHAATVKQLMEELLSRLMVEGSVEVSPGEDGLAVEIVSPDAALLIGNQGETLEAVQYLLRAMSQQAIGEFVALTVDIEGYRQRRSESLLALAARVATKVKSTGRPEALNPMSASDRRLIHMKVKEMDGVVSESIGEGRERQVVIKPIMKEIR